MSAPPATRRSVYADKLRDFSEFAFGDDAAFHNRGRWREFFRERIGPAFDGRVMFEIGCSDADFLGRIAGKFPTTGFVGLDWKCRALYDAARRVGAKAVRNIALIRGRGQDVSRIFADGEVNEAWVFHPDPCDRDVELKNRLIAEPFLLDVHRALHDGRCVLALKTDHAGYYQWVLGLLGLPEPGWLRPGPATVEPGAPGAGLTTVAAARRVRAPDLMRAEDIPPRNHAICDRFAVAVNAPDYWHDVAALAHTADRCFAGEITAYESRFVKERRPIFYVELQKRSVVE